MSSKLYWVLLFIVFSISTASGQMVSGPDTLVGNEWIRYGTTYYKFSVSADGVYRIAGETLQAAGIDLASHPGSTVRLYSMGKQVPLHVSTDGVFAGTDFIEFYGYRNRSEMDRHLFLRPDTDMLNPEYSLYTDNRYYFLAFEGDDTPLRVEELVNDLANPPAAAPYYLHNEILLYNNAHFDPYYPADGNSAVTYSSYWHSEGFGKGDESTTTITIPASHVATSGPDATLRIRFTSSNNQNNHEFPILWNDVVIGTLEPFQITIIDTTFTLPLSSIQASNQLKIDTEHPISRFTIAQVTLTYPRETTVDGASQLLMHTPTSLVDYYFVLDNFSHENAPPLIYSADGSKRMVTELNGDNDVHFRWPSTAGSPQFNVRNAASGISAITILIPKVFSNIASDDTEYVVISHPQLLEPGTESEYVQYRSSPQGGQYRAKAYSILELYDEFGYGIEKHPQAIRNFVEFISRQWPAAKMIFIIGRGIEYNRSRLSSTSWEPFFFVPTFGKPGADNLLAARNWDLIPRYPIGRLAVVNQTEISEYLSKVKEHDVAINQGEQSLEDKVWIKNVIHIAGGKSQTEQIEFKETLTELGEDLAASDFGARVFHFQKESSDVISESQSKQIEKLLHDGSTIINYLGHSSASTFEYTINDAAEWNNKGRYPVFSAMGCTAGQIHGPVHSLSDRYVLIPDEGAIAFISGSGSQFPGALIAWARPWYAFIGTTNYGDLLGESIRHGLQAVGNFVNPFQIGSNHYRYLLEQQTFQGDPALRLNPLPGPDYLVDRKSVSLTPELLSTDLDSFTIRFSIFNIGRNLRQETSFRVRLRLPEGNEILLLQDTLTASHFETAVNRRIALPSDLQPGSYRLLIDVDPDNVLEELPAPAAENNNRLEDHLGVEGISIVLVSNLVVAIYPDNYAIVNKEPILIAAGSDPFSTGLNIRAEIDTTALFNSPLRIRQDFNDHPALLKWSPPMNWINDQVYYWRVSYDSLSPELPHYWSQHSFIYKPGSPTGWNQSHFYQFNEDLLQQIEPDSQRWSFNFGHTVYNFRILNRYQNPAAGELPFGYIDNVFYTEFFTKFTGNNVQVFVAAVNPATGDFLLNPSPGLYGSLNNLNYDIHCFPFNTDTPEGRKALMDFVDDIIPDDYIVFIYTYQRAAFPTYFPEQWAGDEAIYGKSIFSVVENQFPASNIRSLATTGSKPYIVQFRKNAGPIQEIIAADTADVISLSYDIERPLHEGKFISTIIGPASQWHSIRWDIAVPAIDSAGADRLTAWALSADLQDTLWISHNLQSKDTMIEDIDAAAWPYMQLAFFTQDSIQRIPSDIFHWRVLYEGYPEFIFNPEHGFTFIADTLFQGQDMSLHTYVENISDYPATDIPVVLRILGGDNTTAEVFDTIPQLDAQAAAPVYFQKNTKGLEGDYQVVAEINPGRAVNELLLSNNIGVLPMHVIGDKVNPVLDVTFDGYHISDGDLVASKPLISIRLHDENAFLRIEDTSAFTIYLKYPSDTEPRYVAFRYDWVTFIPPGDTGRNETVVELRPDLTEEGNYELIVQARDASGNEAGDYAYYVSFRVIHDKSVSHIYNFPNPFRTSTRFIYTLTGESSPAFYKIQIVSVTGVVVREITSDEIGPLAVGTHMTNFEWDGTDDNGNQLAGGTYLYHMIVRDENQQDYKLYQPSDGGQVIRHDWGKLVILR